ncbi:hypothetical protein [Verminephrobacter eiseniae]|nr:hypothetical protein [Verminephrobacter eiseniae]
MEDFPVACQKPCEKPNGTARNDNSARGVDRGISAMLQMITASTAGPGLR